MDFNGQSANGMSVFRLPRDPDERMKWIEGLNIKKSNKKLKKKRAYSAFSAE
jgi:hypothetical protein